MITTIVFDLDDTLYDEIEYCKSGFASVADFLAPLEIRRRLLTGRADLSKAPEAKRIFDCLWEQFTAGLPPRLPPRLLVEDKSGGAAGNRTKTFNAALDELDVSYDEKLIAELINVYRNHIPKITLPQDSRDVLSQLSDKYTLALLTDGFLPAQKLKVQALGIGKYFKCIVYTEELGRDYWKPSPAGFEKLLQTLNVKPETIACIADNEEKDFIAPNRLGFLTIQIIRSARIHTSTSRQTGAAAQYVIQKISELPALLEKLGTE